jgi:uncharacterized protein involved in cysteine biosynthesis
LICAAVLVAVVFKLRSWFKHGQKPLEQLRDSGHEFLLFIVICFSMLFAAVTVMQTIAEHTDKIAAFFAAVREKCEPVDEPPGPTIDQFIERELNKLRAPP